MGLFDYSNAADSLEPLQEITFLADLSSEDWARVLKIVKSRVFRAGDDLIRAGDKDDSFYILTSGEVEVTIGDKVLATIPEGSVFGEISFFDGALRSATIRAKSKGSAVRVTRDDLDTLAAWEPEIARKMLFDLGRVLAMRLRWTTRLAAS
ncbi:MAG: cyclic nucleotide-binding domain-containing protein [Rhodocyclaceae bacterium]|nr:cyclic nucleotide-binding domain-containing protein [Rhodocyclaceae bacterium]MBP7080556.1 cyclic nucleotide-binding domain-containing protein [Rhodocyclaceae bacterium]